jgi:DNA-binding NarL/FixJ family response regulator
MNGIDVARQIASFSPQSKVVFVSQNRDADLVQEALETGASGYLLKSSVAIDLAPALEAVFAGERFVSPAIMGERASQTVQLDS